MIAKILGWCGVFILTIFSSLVLQQCAVQIPPTGGPRDSLPPVLINANPKDSNLNFKGKTIVFKFNEFLTAEGLTTSFYSNPILTKTPNINQKLNTITIQFKDSLPSNTTYTIGFKKGIKDFNEGNAINNFSYLFSTGNNIDKGILKGSVIDAATGKTDSTLMLVLYKNGADSAVIKENPSYSTFCTNNNNFEFTNIADGTYYLYALENEANNYRYANTDKKFAFSSTPIIINNGVANNTPTLEAFIAPKKETSKPTTTAATDTKNQDKRLKFETNLINNKQDLLNPLEISFNRAIASLKKDETSLLVNNQPQNFSLVIDSANSKKIILNSSWVENTNYSFIVNKPWAADSAGVAYYKNLDTVNFTTKKLAEYGSITLDFKNLPTGTKLLQFIKNEKPYATYSLVGNKYFNKIYEPGEYQIKIIIDSNNNGQWDTGDFFNGKKQPEKVYNIAEKISIRANFDKQYNIIL
jgi:hypothetical protein